MIVTSLLRPAVLGLFVVLVLPPARADQDRVSRANYKLANQFSKGYVRQFVYDTAVTPHWIGKTDSFWYSFRTSQGTNYYRVNPKLKTKEPLFDRTKLGTLLSETTHRPLDPAALPLTRVTLNDEGTKLKFVVEDEPPPATTDETPKTAKGKGNRGGGRGAPGNVPPSRRGTQFEYDLTSEKLTKLGPAPLAPGGLGDNPFAGRGGGGQFGGGRGLFTNQQNQDTQRQDQQQRQDQDKTDQEKEKIDPQQQKGRGRRGGGQGKGEDGKGGFAGRGADYKAYSPDRKAYVYAQKHNLYLVEGDTKEEDAVQITKDGNTDYTFAGGLGQFGGRGRGNTDDAGKDDAKAKANPDRKTRPNVTWSKDSKAFYVSRRDVRGEKDLFLVNSLTEPRPTLETYKYAMPGEDNVPKSELYIFQRDGKKLTRMKPKWKDETIARAAWGKTSSGELWFLREDRLLRHVELCCYSLTSGECKCLLTEGFDNAPIFTQPIHYIDESNEMLWWSERGGWGHYFLYDGTGKLKNAVTAGTFRAGSIAAVDPKNRTLYFFGNAREPNENVYYQHLYSVHLDGTGLTLLDPGNANHTSVLSPTRQYLVDNASRTDMAPISVVRDATGALVMELEKADLSRLYETGWKMPDTFVVKAADGMTDLYGNMWKPFDFDPKKKYPIIAHVYPGPQTEGVTHTFAADSPNQQLAQLGFIVIQVGHRGGAPGRSKAYASYGYFNLRDYGLADKKTAIEQLAARFPFIDIEKVGIYGHSGGGFMSAAALLQKPYNDFFKAAVASAGNHDNNIYNNTWSERYHGLREVVLKKNGDSKGKAATGTATGAGAGGGAAQNGNGDEDGAKDDAEKKDEKKDEKTTTDAKDEKTDEKKDEKSTTDSKEEKKDEKTDAKTEEEEIHFEIKVPTNAELAANLKGALLLVHGEIDNNVHPANTIRLVDALIKANKRFDMLILPGQRHAFGPYQPYFTQRMWEFFADHLMGDRPTGADISDKR
jgi:dipeptidyl aminopeptidase/acylaminoacyl peptidase